MALIHVKEQYREFPLFKSTGYMCMSSECKGTLLGQQSDSFPTNPSNFAVLIMSEMFCHLGDFFLVMVFAIALLLTSLQ